MPRPRKPNKLKLLHGTTRKDRARTEVDFPPCPPDDQIPPPDWLVNPDAVAEWRNSVALLLPVRVLTRADLVMLGHFCNLHGDMVALYRAGRDMPTAAQYAQLRMYANEFGFTPASRSKAQPAGGEETKNPFAQLTG